MAFFDFRIADKVYDVNDVTDHVNSTHDALALYQQRRGYIH